jgi:hypothetical protein
MEHGFLTYKFEKPDILFVNDVYVSPDKRGGSTYLKLAQCAEQIGYEAGCKHMMGVVYLNTNNPSLSIKSILAYGLSPISADQGKIFFRKDIHAQSI